MMQLPKLLDAQREFLEVPHSHPLDVALYQGGYASGKTFAGALIGLLLCEKYPGIRGLVGAQTFPLVRDTTLVQYQDHLDKLGYKEGLHYKHYRQEAKITFCNKSEILFRHLEEADKIKSLNLGFVEIEEMSDVPESTFNMLLGRLRQADIPRYRLFGHTNPESCKGWIYQTFVEKPKPNYRLIIAPTTQNTFLRDGFVDDLRTAYDPEYFRINVLGEFGDYTSGLVTKGFTQDNIKEINYIPDEPLHLTCDFNKDPMSWILAHCVYPEIPGTNHYDYTKNPLRVYFFDELIIENTDIDQSCKIFLEKFGGHKAKIILNGDASGDKTNAGDLRSYFKRMKDNFEGAGLRVERGFKPYNPYKSTRIESWNAKICNFNGDRGVFISPKCKWLLYNIYNLKYKPGTSVIDEPSKHLLETDRNTKFLVHPFDAASYLVDYYWPVQKERK